MHPYYIGSDLSNYMSRILTYSNNQHADIELNYQKRIAILDVIIDYYCLHNEGLSNIKSLAVLKEVFH